MGTKSGWGWGKGEGGHVSGLLDKGTSVEGKLTFDGTLQINGDFRGEIYSDGMLIVGPNATINAKMVVDTVIVDGYVEGVVEAKTKVILKTPGRLIADVTAQNLVIEEGGIFHGVSRMRRVEDIQVVRNTETSGEQLYAPEQQEEVVN